MEKNLACSTNQFKNWTKKNKEKKKTIVVLYIKFTDFFFYVFVLSCKVADMFFSQLFKIIFSSIARILFQAQKTSSLIFKLYLDVPEMSQKFC